MCKDRGPEPRGKLDVEPRNLHRTWVPPKFAQGLGTLQPFLERPGCVTVPKVQGRKEARAAVKKEMPGVTQQSLNGIVAGTQCS